MQNRFSRDRKDAASAEHVWKNKKLTYDQEELGIVSRRQLWTCHQLPLFRIGVGSDQSTLMMNLCILNLSDVE